jgi:hypothetical protein
MAVVAPLPGEPPVPEGMRRCRSCRVDLPDTADYFRAVMSGRPKKDGTTDSYPCIDCKDCEYERKLRYAEPPDPDTPFGAEPIWDQQPGETDRAFGAFTVYRAMPRYNRTIIAVSKDLGRTYSMVHIWSRKWRWLPRARAYEAWEDDRRRHAEAQAVVALNDKHGRIGAQMFRKVAQRIIGDDDNKIAGLDPNQLSPYEVAKLAEVAVKLERMALGLSDTVTAKVVGAGGGPIEVEHSGLPDPSEQTPKHIAEVLTVLLQTGAIKPEQLGLNGHENGVVEQGNGRD